MKILYRYILAEMAWPFIGGLLTFVVLIAGHMLFLPIEVLLDHRVPIVGVLRYVAYQVPWALTMALPVATLLACCLALNRLARDHELVAIRTAGVTLFRIMVPPLALGTIATGMSVWLSGSLAPLSRQASEDLLRDIVLQQKALAFKPGQFVDTGRGVTFFVSGVDPAHSRVSGVFAFMLRVGDSPVLLWGKEAIFGKNTLTIPYPRVYALESNGALSLSTESQTFKVDLTQVGRSPNLPLGEMQSMSLADLQRQRTVLRSSGPQAVRPYDVEINSRLALAFACVVFALLSGPITLKFGRGQSLVGVLATVIIVFVFYIGMLWTRMVASSQGMPVVPVIWAEDGLLLLLALWAIWRYR